MSVEETSTDIISRLNDNIVGFQNIVARFLPHDPELWNSLQDLGDLLQMRYEQTGDIQDVHQAIAYQQRALELTPSDHLNLSNLLNSLGLSFLIRYQSTDMASDIEQAIVQQQRAVDLTPSGHPDLPEFLTNLGSSLQTLYQRTAKVSDLDQAIAYQRRAVDLTEIDDPNLPGFLSSLGMALQSRFERTRHMQNLDQAILCQQQVMDLTPSSHPNLPGYLNNLAVSLQSLYTCTAEMEHLDQSIKYHHQAVNLTSTNHPNLVFLLSNLGNSLQKRYERTADLCDLDEAVAHKQRAVGLTTRDHPDLPTLLSNLGHALRTRYDRTAQLWDLDQSISLTRQAVALTPSDHAELPGCLNNLGLSLETRYERTAEMGDLDHAIEHQKQAVDITPIDHPNLPLWLTNLNNSLQSRYERTADVMDLDQAITNQQRAVDLQRNDPLQLAVSFHYLGTFLQARYDHTAEMSDLNRAITHHQKAVDLTPSDHVYLPLLLNNLGLSLHERYDSTGEIQDLDQAIEYQRRTVDLTPSSHPRLATFLCNLGFALQARYQCKKVSHDQEQAMSAFQKSAAVPYGPTLQKFKATLGWAYLARSTRSPSRIQAFSEAIAFLPQLTWLGQSIRNRQRLLSQIPPGVVGDAAACAIELSDLPLAVELLEQGRSVFWAQMLPFRTDFVDLTMANPKLAEQLKETGRILEQSIFNDTSRLGKQAEDAVQKHHRLVEKWEQLVERIRQIPEFKTFLGRIPFSELQNAASEDGPVVVINISQYRCDALVITHNRPIHLIPLSDLQLKDVEDRSNAFRIATNDWNRNLINDRRFERDLYSILRYLWITVVCPVVDYLGYMDPNLDPTPRIWWCPTGPLTSLPIHAAGPYKRGPDILQRVISSYTSSLAALARARSRDPTSPPKMAVVGISETPYTQSLPKLHHAECEVDAVYNIAVAHKVPALEVKNEDATVERVVSILKDSNIIHVACHAHQDQDTPMDSVLYLGDGCLSLSHIASLRLTNAEFAFLSACRSAEGSPLLPNEAMHLAAGMQVAGYRSLVATMWSMSDWVGPEVVSKFYTHFFRASMPRDPAFAAAAALREVTLALRLEGKVPAAAWVNFISIGV